MIAGLLAFHIAVLFFIMFLALILVKAGVVKSSDSRVLSLLLIYIFSPGTILRSFQIAFTNEVRDGFFLAMAAAVIIHVIMIVFCETAGRALKLDGIEKASVMYPNGGYLVLALLLSVLGDEWLIYASAYMIVQTVMMWTHGIFIISGDKNFSFRKLITNVNLIAVFLGIFLLVTGITLPPLLKEVLDQLKNATGPIGMLMLGMILANVKWNVVFANARIYLITLLRLIILPLIILAVFMLLHLQTLVPDGKTILYISFMAGMMPSALTVSQLAQLYDNRPVFASSVNVFTTLCSIATMPLLTWLYMKLM